MKDETLALARTCWVTPAVVGSVLGGIALGSAASALADPAAAQPAPDLVRGFWDEVNLLLKFGDFPRDGTSYLVFGLASGLASLGVFLLDVLACASASQRRGFLGIDHGRYSVILAVVWFFGGAVAGVLGYAVRIFEGSLIAAGIAGITWRTFLKVLLAFAEAKLQDVQQTPRQQGGAAPVQPQVVQPTG